MFCFSLEGSRSHSEPSLQSEFSVLMVSVPCSKVCYLCALSGGPLKPHKEDGSFPYGNKTAKKPTSLGIQTRILPQAVDTQAQRQLYSIQSQVKREKPPYHPASIFASSPIPFPHGSQSVPLQRNFDFLLSKNRKDIPSCLPPECKLQGL